MDEDHHSTGGSSQGDDEASGDLLRGTDDWEGPYDDQLQYDPEVGYEPDLVSEDAEEDVSGAEEDDGMWLPGWEEDAETLARCQGLLAACRDGLVEAVAAGLDGGLDVNYRVRVHPAVGSPAGRCHVHVCDE
jgi:hypothetical protein